MCGKGPNDVVWAQVCFSSLLCYLLMICYVFFLQDVNFLPLLSPANHIHHEPLLTGWTFCVIKCRSTVLGPPHQLRHRHKQGKSLPQPHNDNLVSSLFSPGSSYLAGQNDPPLAPVLDRAHYCRSSEVQELLVT
jgi:hypothetical protein